MKLGRISQSPREHFHNAIAWNFCFHPTIKNLEIDISIVGVEENPSYPSYSRNCSQIYLSIKRDKLFDFNGKKLFPYALALVFLSKHHLAILLLHFRIIFVNPPQVLTYCSGLLFLKCCVSRLGMEKKMWVQMTLLKLPQFNTSSWSRAWSLQQLSRKTTQRPSVYVRGIFLRKNVNIFTVIVLILAPAWGDYILNEKKLRDFVEWFHIYMSKTKTLGDLTQRLVGS